LGLPPSKTTKTPQAAAEAGFAELLYGAVLLIT
jgi:hypothetical protein